jgi:hypothetical protein
VEQGEAESPLELPTRPRANAWHQKADVKVGDEVKGNYQSVIGKIGATGTSLSKSGAFHLHASCAPAPQPHAADRKVLKDLFKLIDKSSAERKAAKEAKNV